MGPPVRVLGLSFSKDKIEILLYSTVLTCVGKLLFVYRVRVLRFSKGYEGTTVTSGKVN